NTQSN
ncbi:hypothetical protein VCEM1676A_003137B, partial [Vibrio cholerae O1 str. EM-1676A]